jgi:hypothetical protein
MIGTTLLILSIAKVVCLVAVTVALIVGVKEIKKLAAK